jgi:hypothetical protein
MTQQVRDADRVLVIASPEYKRRAEGGAGPDEGRGVQWEARLIRESFYADQEAGLQRFITVVLPGCSAADIPLWLAPMSTAHYLVSEYTAPGAETLLRALTGQPAELEPPLGSVPVLAPRGTAEPPVTPTRVEAGPVVRSAYLEQVRQIAPPQLRDRNSELAELAAFCTEQDRDSYVWWRAPAWAGKSALMSWFVLHPPPAVQIASFFITARYQGQDDRAAFTDAVMRPPVRQSKVVTSLASLDGRRLATGVIAVPSRIRLIVNAAAVSRIHGSAISQRRFFSPTA